MSADRWHWRAIVAATVAIVALAASGLAAAQTPPAPGGGDGIHLGVASCAGDNCHGAVKRGEFSSVEQNEYLIWSLKDKHSRAFKVLSTEPALRIARNLGLPGGKRAAETAQICLDCHADNVPESRRGPRFQLADGVGCEACHGGAVGWLGIHISGAPHRANLAAGLYPTEQPLARAERCLSCHVGEGNKFATHRIMGAGHPPIGFELDTYTAIQPAHYHVTAAYIARKGRPNDMQIWAVGQAVDLKKRMDLLIDPNNAPKGATPELALFDCQACHHAMSQLQWRARAATGLGPGQLRLYDANLVMLRVIAARVAPDAAEALATHMLALHQASAAPVPDYWAGVQREAAAVRKAAETLIPALEKHEFDQGDARALAQALIAVGVGGADLDYSAAQQQYMALQSVVAAMNLLSFADVAQINALNDALGGIGKTLADDQAYRPEIFVAALRQFEAKLPR